MIYLKVFVPVYLLIISTKAQTNSTKSPCLDCMCDSCVCLSRCFCTGCYCNPCNTSITSEPPSFTTNPSILTSKTSRSTTTN